MKAGGWWKLSPLQVVDFVCVLSLLAVLLVGLILQHLHSLSTARLVLAGLGHRVQLAHLVLGGTREKSRLDSNGLKRVSLVKQGAMRDDVMMIRTWTAGLVLTTGPSL